MSDIDIDHRLWNNLNILQSTTGLNNGQFAKCIGMSDKKYHFLKNNQLMLPFGGVYRLACNLGLKIDSVLSSDLNQNLLEESLRNYFQGLVPDEYKNAFGSKSFTIRNILKIAKKYGVYQDVCAHFDLKDLAFESHIDFQVSVELASDVLNYIASRVQLNEIDFEDMSYGNAFHFKDTDFGKTLAACQKPVEIYEHLMRVVHNVEQNWDYRIERADDKSILISSFPSEQITDVYKRKDFSSYNFTKFRAAMGAHLTKYIGMEGATTMITRSIHMGHSYCQFRIDYSDLKPLSA